MYRFQNRSGSHFAGATRLFPDGLFGHSSASKKTRIVTGAGTDLASIRQRICGYERISVLTADAAYAFAKVS